MGRTTPMAEVKKKSEGMSIFLVDLHEAIGHGMTVAARELTTDVAKARRDP